MSDLINLKKDNYLVREGDQSFEMYYLNEGMLGVFKLKGNTERQIGTIYKGELVGEMSFLDNSPRSASVKAMDDCELSVIPRDKLEKYLSKQPPWLKALHSTLLDRLRKANQRVKI